MTCRAVGVPGLFPPLQVTAIRKIACSLPKELNLPFSRLSLSDIAKAAIKRGVVESISKSTVNRVLSSAAIKPWQYHSWLFPMAPDFLKKAEAILDLYQGIYQGRKLDEDEYVICADEKTSIQARIRLCPTLPPKEEVPIRVAHEYKRGGATNYMAGWDVFKGRLIGKCVRRKTKAAFRSLVCKIMEMEPYKSAKRVFFVVDNGSTHRPETFGTWLQEKYQSKAVAVHLPTYSSWLNQIEIIFSVLQRKVLTPNYVGSLAELVDNIMRFEALYNAKAKPIDWNFTTDKFKDMMQKVA